MERARLGSLARVWQLLTGEKGCAKEENGDPGFLMVLSVGGLWDDGLGGRCVCGSGLANGALRDVAVPVATVEASDAGCREGRL